MSSGDRRVPHSASGGRVPVHRSAAESAAEHDVLHPVLLCHGPHVLHAVHDHGESPPGLQGCTLWRLCLCV